jgi:hypothetical protein
MRALRECIEKVIALASGIETAAPLAPAPSAPRGDAAVHVARRAHGSYWKGL